MYFSNYDTANSILVTGLLPEIFYYYYFQAKYNIVLD